MKGAFLNRLIELGAHVAQLTDAADVRAAAATAHSNNKRAKGKTAELSTAGQMEAKAAGVTVLLTGAYSVRVVVECVLEVVFSAAKLQKAVQDLPKLVASVPFAHSVAQRLHPSFVQCQHDFRAGAAGSAAAGKGMGKGTARQQPVHRVVFSGPLGATALGRLADALQALARASGGSASAPLPLPGRAAHLKALHTTTSATTSAAAFDLSVLDGATFDASFMHRATVASSDDRKGTERDKATVSVAGASVGLGGRTGVAESVKLKIPMMFVSKSVDKRATAGAAGAAGPELDETSEAEETGSDEDVDADVGGAVAVGPARDWSDRCRRRGRPYFIVRAAAAPRIAAFAYAGWVPSLSSAAAGTLGAAVPVAAGTGAVVGAAVGGVGGQPVWLHAAPPVAEVRWRGAGPSDGPGNGSGTAVVVVSAGAGPPAVGLLQLSFAAAADAAAAAAAAAEEQAAGVVLPAPNAYDAHAPDTVADRERRQLSKRHAAASQSRGAVASK